MTRITSLLVSAALLCGAAFGGSRAESTTYVEGNLTGISPNTGGTLTFSDDKAVSFRTGLGSVVIPYANINKAELGVTKVRSENAPLYKVWSLHKRFTGKNKTESQFLKLEFKNEEGEDKTMTLELAHSAAAAAISTIESHGGTVAASDAKAEVAAAPAKAASKPAADEWWGDSYWKTKRNADKWSKPAATNTNDQR